MIVQIIQGLVMGMFLMVGVMKWMTPKEKLAPKMPWVNDFSQSQIKLISFFELLSAFLLFLGFFSISFVGLSRIGSWILCVVMLGAVYTHIRRKEFGNIVLPAILLLGALYLSVSL